MKRHHKRPNISGPANQTGPNASSHCLHGDRCTCLVVCSRASRFVPVVGPRAGCAPRLHSCPTALMPSLGSIVDVSLAATRHATRSGLHGNNTLRCLFTAFQLFPAVTPAVSVLHSHSHTRAILDYFFYIYISFCSAVSVDPITFVLLASFPNWPPGSGMSIQRCACFNPVNCSV